MERRGHRGPNDANGASYQSLLGGSLVDYWDAAFGIATVSSNVDTWTGQSAGIVLQAPSGAQRPPYAADGAVFGAKSVVQCTTTGTLVLRCTTLNPALIPAGSRPWMGVCGRIRTSATANLFGIGRVADGAGAQQMDVYSLSGDLHMQVAAADKVVLAGGVATTRIFFEIWADGVNAYIAKDGVNTSAVFAGSTSGACDRIGVGDNAITAGGSPADMSFAQVFLCNAYPGAAAAAGVRALSLAAYPP